MSIKIKFEKVMVRGEMKIKIIKIQALSKEELPIKYIADGEPHCYKANYVRHDNKRVRMLEIHVIGSCSTIEEGHLYSPLTFGKACAHIKKSGERLTEINKDIERLKLSWRGTSEITI
jgi:hypothetical protein